MQQLLSYNELKAFGVRYSKSHLYYLMQRDEFPRPAKLSANTVAWIKEDVEHWIDAKIKNHRASNAKSTIQKEVI